MATTEACWERFTSSASNVELVPRRCRSFSTYCNCALQVGVSPSALRSLEVVVRKAILEYQQQQQKALGETQTAIEICAGADETAFEQVEPETVRQKLLNLRAKSANTNSGLRCAKLRQNTYGCI